MSIFVNIGLHDVNNPVYVYYVFGMNYSTVMDDIIGQNIALFLI